MLLYALRDAKHACCGAQRRAYAAALRVTSYAAADVFDDAAAAAPARRYYAAMPR